MTTIAQLHEAFLRCTGVCTDTRALAPGSLFVALRGPSFNANAFAAQALAGGCRHALVDDPAVAKDDRYLLVPDALKALQQLALHHRRRFAIPVVAITGTNGKTTTKELVHAVLAADRPTLATNGNLNNHIGVPLTLLRLTAEHRIAIIEMGANHVGDIAELMALAEPTHGLITNIGRAHLEGFGSYEGVVKAKTELFDFLRGRGGTLFVHANDPLLMTKSEGLARVTYGSIPDCDTRGQAIPGDSPFLELVFTGREGSEKRVRTRLIGGYNAPNALAAVCIGQHFGVPDGMIAHALADYTPANNRSQFTDTGRNQLVLDAYNANPSSMKEALENFVALPGARPKLAILGVMKELGADSHEEHEAVVALVRRLGLDAVYVGPEFTELAASGDTAYADVNAALDAFRRSPIEGRLILVKGSRGTRLEALVPAL
jgi:UDP-N-acetylmuramoyl-tripeptide--D-alanyl-D-alanine ligase